MSHVQPDPGFFDTVTNPELIDELFKRFDRVILITETRNNQGVMENNAEWNGSRGHTRRMMREAWSQIKQQRNV